MPRTLAIEVPKDFSFRHTIQSHGWYDLAPFEIDDVRLTLSYVFADPISPKPFKVTISEANGGLEIQYSASKVDKKKLESAVKHILRLDDDLTTFYEKIKEESGLAWVGKAKAGRLLRSPTVFEDLVKTICTTNCSWALTKKMTTNLVEKLGSKSLDGGRAFPTAEAMAAMPDGDRTGLTASKARSSASTSGSPRRSSSRARRPASLCAALRDVATRITSKSRPASSASPTRCAPSSSTRRPAGSGVAARARNDATTGLWRLEIVRTKGSQASITDCVTV